MTRFFALAARGAQRLPRPALEFLGGTLLLGWGFFRHPLRRRIVLANFRRILEFSGQRADSARLSELMGLTRRSYTRLLLSMLCRPEDLAFACERFDAGALLCAIETARSKGKGAVVALSNFGPFTYAIMALLQRGAPIRVPILRRASVSHLPPGWPESFLTVGDASRQCLRALRRNEVVVVITMVNYLARRPTLDLFGAPARLGYAPAALAAASGAPILPVFCLADAERGRAEVEPPIEAEAGPGAVERTTARLARVQERWIARHPHLWHVYEDFWDLAGMDRGYNFIRRVLRWF